MHVAEHRRRLEKRAKPCARHDILRQPRKFRNPRPDVLQPPVAAFQFAEAGAQLLPDVARGIRHAAHQLLQLAVRTVEAHEHVEDIARRGDASAHDVAHLPRLLAEHGLAAGQALKLPRRAQLVDLRDDLLAEASDAVHEPVAEERQLIDDLARLADVVGGAGEVVEVLVELLEARRDLVGQVVRALYAVHHVARGVRVHIAALHAVQCALHLAER